MISLHYPGINPGDVCDVKVVCAKCGKKITIIKNGKSKEGICKNSKCIRRKKRNALIFTHTETILM